MHPGRWQLPASQAGRPQNDPTGLRLDLGFPASRAVRKKRSVFKPNPRLPLQVCGALVWQLQQANARSFLLSLEGSDAC